MGTDKTGSVKRGLVADPGGCDSWGEQRPHRLGALSAERGLRKQLISGPVDGFQLDRRAWGKEGGEKELGGLK